MGMSSMSARISGVLSPIILLLGNLWAPLPLLVFGINSIIAGLLVLCLPETLNSDLPQSLAEGEEFGSKYFLGLNFPVKKMMHITQEILVQISVNPVEPFRYKKRSYIA